MVRLIDADALLINLDGMMEVSPTGYIHGETVADMISDAPTVDAEPVRHGKWILWRDLNGIKRCKCSECIVSYGNMDTPYCPNCGAIMDGGEE